MVSQERRRSSICCGILVAFSAAVLVVEEVQSAAIPMWEYLSKDEKMSYLYSMFANQVEDYCEFTDMQDCNRELLKYGLGKLKEMPEDHLDMMDPYQRGAHTLIWDSMMEGHQMMKKPKTRRPMPAANKPTPKPNSYEDDQFAWKTGNNNDYQGSASAKIETVVYRLPPPKGFIISSGPSQYINLKGYVQAPNSLGNHQYQPQVHQYHSVAQQYQPQKQQPQRQQQAEVVEEDDMVAGDSMPLTGPMVVKVHLDGTPVEEKVVLPQDEDLKQYQMSKVKIPAIH